VGLDVAIQEAHPGDDPLKNVLDGNAQYGVGNSSLLLARSSGTSNDSDPFDLVSISVALRGWKGDKLSNIGDHV
jgi:hypothetical protein